MIIKMPMIKMVNPITATINFLTDLSVSFNDIFLLTIKPEKKFRQGLFDIK